MTTQPSPVRLAPPRWLKWTGFLLVAGYLLFNHGCHGREDNELFAVLRGILCSSE
jgi:hypothetical protein